MLLVIASCFQVNECDRHKPSSTRSPATVFKVVKIRKFEIAQFENEPIQYLTVIFFLYIFYAVVFVNIESRMQRFQFDGFFSWQQLQLT